MISSKLELAVRLRDFLRIGYCDPGPERAITAGLGWLAIAQDSSATKDGGVARHFSLKTGWSSSYPETTGYIVPTLLHGGYDPLPDASARRADRMLDWLISIQFPEGGFQGGMVDQTPRVPVTFNTGQILLGLAAGASRNPLYKAAMIKAADWLKTTQDDDGCWRKFATPFAKKGDKTYETHVSLGLFAAHAVEPHRGYREAGLKQVDWALRNQHENGWLAQCCVNDAQRPLTHTLGYALRGIIGAYESAKRQRDLDAAVKIAEALKTQQQPDGKLAGRFDSLWRPAVPWTCLTGLSQIAECWFLLASITGRAEFADAGKRANGYVRRTMVTEGPQDIKGGVKGSLPVSGDYGRWQYLNWACKFTIDANRAELAAEGRN